MPEKTIQIAVAHGLKEPFSYHGEVSVVLNDWWHKIHLKQSTGLASIPFAWTGEPQVKKYDLYRYLPGKEI